MPLFIGLGFASAFLSGLVGIGGAVILIPALAYVPPALGLAPLGIKTIAGVTLVQVAAAGGIGAWRHRRAGAVRGDLVLPIGASMAVASWVGAMASDLVDASVLQAVFATMAIAAGAALVFRRADVDPLPADGRGGPAGRPVAIATGGGIGLVSGLVGVGGAFLLVPVLVQVLRVPVRTAIGSSLAIVTLGALAGALGKAMTGQVEWALAAALVVGAIPGVILGAYASRRAATPVLTWVLTAIVLLAGVRMWVDVLSGG